MKPIAKKGTNMNDFFLALIKFFKKMRKIAFSP
jgi:hypothetical protein